jgi:hypothetical protein
VLSFVNIMSIVVERKLKSRVLHRAFIVQVLK